MPGELKDIALIVDGQDPLADAVQASIALHLADHHAARLVVFEQGQAETIEHLSWGEEMGDSDYGNVTVCGVHEEADLGRHFDTSAMAKLLRRTHEGGAWFKEAEARTLLERLHCADLAIIGLPATLECGSTPNIEDIIVQAGRPILIIPRRFAERRAPDRTVGHRILISWNNSAACARAIHDALPFLREAQEITLLHADDGKTRSHVEHAMAGLTEHLVRHGIKTRTDIAACGSRSASRIILDHVEELQADLLVMGAFSRSRFAEALLGSISANLLHNVTIPIFTSN